MPGIRRDKQANGGKSFVKAHGRMLPAHVDKRVQHPVRADASGLKQHEVVTQNQVMEVLSARLKNAPLMGATERFDVAFVCP